MNPPIRLLFVFLTLSLISFPVFAQDDSSIVRELRQLEDGTRPLDARVLLADQLLSGGHPLALDGLRRLLSTGDTDPDLRRAIIRLAISHPALALYPDVVRVLAGEQGTEFFDDSARVFRAWARGALFGRLAATANLGAAPEEERLVAIHLLGATRAKAAMEPLIRIWEASPEPFAERAQAALYLILPRRFREASEARAYWERHKTEDLSELLRKLLAGSGGNGQTDPGRDLLLELIRALAADASLTRVIDNLLSCREDAGIRRIGVEKLIDYPFADREGKAGRTRAAAAVVTALGLEDDREVTVLLLATFDKLAGSLAAEDREKALELCVRLLTHPRREVRLAVVEALGDLKDLRALEHLTAGYDRLGAKDVDLRIAILDSIERIGDGIGGWVHDKLKAGDKEERIQLRLIQLVKGYVGQVEFIPTLADLLKNSGSSDRVRREAASALGIVGVAAGHEEAIDALALFGLVDKDPSVRVIAATQLGRVEREVRPKVVEMLRQRVGEAEGQERVRLAAARSLLKLTKANAVASLGDRLRDDDFWSEVVRNFLKADLIGAKDAAESARFVRALRKGGFPLRCEEAARLVMDAQELSWEGAAEASRRDVAFDLAASLGANGKPDEGLKVLGEEFPEELPTEEKGYRLAVLRATLQRLNGAPEEALAALGPVLDAEDVPADLAGLARLVQARSLTDQKKYDAAIAILTPLLDDPEVGKAAKSALDDAQQKKAGSPEPALTPTPATLAKALDGEDAAARQGAIDKLKGLGKSAHDALLAWLTKKEPGEVPGALETIQKITGITVPFDPKNPAPDGKTVVDRLREALAANGG